MGARTSRHSIAWLEDFLRAIGDIPEIVEGYRFTGETDYLRHLVVPGVEVYAAIYKKLISRLDFAARSLAWKS
ncbi:Lrp/AsnC ligand binding domain-containing protein [Bradyrhizobium sp. CCBAU 11361]|uniref:Lrp/AsnC ligand binding domain-containing protein n=1 Tax=Bradyrhizobium sp. CCBAU 11361 TaxID=1630812 RepID=UPI0023035409|nr:Lrp/AsnC ligand binding domain-containing protein [Bradyrhizobium sp. CCBAU 11361]